MLTPTMLGARCNRLPGGRRRVLAERPGTAAPANDAFSAALLLSGRQLSVSGSNDEATKEPGEPNHAGESGGASIWYEWTAPAAGRTTVSTCATPTLNTVLAVYTGAAVDALTQVAANDNACGSQSRVTFQAAVGATYRIAVDGVGGELGDVELDLRLSPPNDDFDDAVGVAGDAGSSAGLTTGASMEADEPDICGSAIRRSGTAGRPRRAVGRRSRPAGRP